jgi:hypothetical protein
VFELLPMLLLSSNQQYVAAFLPFAHGSPAATLAFAPSPIQWYHCRQHPWLPLRHSQRLPAVKSTEDIPETLYAELLVDIPLENNDNDIQSTNKEKNVWESMASIVYNTENEIDTSTTSMRDYVQLVTILRVGIPSVLLAVTAKTLYPSTALFLASLINDEGAFAVISQDSSQYIQNVLTTSGLVFSLLVGQTYYFMYQQQEAIYLALYQEVTVAKSLLEQIGLISQGRSSLYRRILQCMDHYVQNDLRRFNDIEPAVMLSARPVDDPLEDILYLTSVGEPSIIYQTVRSLRQARAYRLGALQKKLPSIHMTLLWSLAAIVLCSFPLLGAGAQTIGGMGILTVQSWYLSFIVFAICLVMGVVYELQRPGETGAYNARTVLQVMVAGLDDELKSRLNGDFVSNTNGPTLDSNGSSADATFLNHQATAAMLPLETANEVLRGRTDQSSTIVDVVVASKTSNRNENNDTLLGSSSKSDNQKMVKKKGIRNKVKAWAFDVVQNSVTKFK